MANIRASIDIGSNSILLLVASVFDGKIVEVLANESVVTGLGKDLDKKGEFIESSMRDSYETLERYAAQCLKFNIVLSEVVVTATEASRVAKNAKQFFKRVNESLGLKIVTITGEAEAYYSTCGILIDKAITEDAITIMDIGGASTELIKVSVKDKKIIESFSMPVGAVRFTNWLAENDGDSLAKVFRMFEENLEKMNTECLVCVAGTMTSVASMHLGLKKFSEGKIHNLQISLDSMKILSDQIDELSVEEIKDKYPLLGKRSSSIKAGIKLAIIIFDLLGVKKSKISTYGLRYGTLLSGGIRESYVFKN